MKIIKIHPMNECSRCGHRWKSRKNEKPLICPLCKNPNWDELNKTTLTSLLIGRK